jgi:uncharacterized protein YggU (UPF0235/DUF167 family)
MRFRRELQGTSSPTREEERHYRRAGDAVKLSLTAPPIEGRTNEAFSEFFAKLLKVPRSSVTIASGRISPNKVIRVVGINADEVKQRLAG